MKIVINGAGEVGVYLAKMLAKESQEIILIDQDKDKLQALEQNVELMGVVGLGTLPSVLKEASVKHADLFIAVTPSESENLTSCVLAKDMGAKKTLARIDNHEYLLPLNKRRFESFGVDSLIYPEMLAAKQILESLKLTGVREIHDFAKDEISMVALKIRENAVCCNRSLMEVFGKGNPFRVVAIQRDNSTFIPRGADSLRVGDIAYILSPKKHIDEVKKITGKEAIRVKHVLIMGGSRIAIKTLQLAPDSLNFKVVEKSKERTLRVVDNISKGLVIEGDGRDVELLKEEGIEDVDAFVALTGNSETNILGCLAAKRLGVKRTIAEVENLDYMSLADGLGIGSLINKKLITASYIYQLTMQVHVSHVKCLSTTEAEIVELVASENSKITKRIIRHVNLPDNVNIGALLREGEVHIVDGDTQVQTGDIVVIFCLGNGIRKIEKFF